MSAIDDIAAERQRQIDEEQWSPEHDDTHDGGELALAAASYAQVAGEGSETRRWTLIPSTWPWSSDWWKPCTPRRALVKAGALIVAEIERLDRASVGEDTDA